MLQLTQPLDGHVCLSCRRNLQRSVPHPRFASAATAEASSSSFETSEPPPTQINTAQAQPRPTYQLHAGIVLSRAPTLTRPLHPFERAFFLYQRRLNERLALPFTRYFYFKKGTPADLEWKRKVKERHTPARDIGVYNPYAKEGWDDEVRVGDKLGEELEDETRRRLIHDVQGGVVGATGSTEAGVGAAPELLESGETAAGKGDQAQTPVDPVALVPSRRRGQDVEKPMDRITQADREGDFKSLDRMGWRTLYLLVKGKDGMWTFPSARLAAKENLRQVSHRRSIYGVWNLIDTFAGRRTSVGAVCGTEYEHLVRRRSADRTLCLDIQASARECGEQNTRSRGKGILPQGTNHGRTSGSHQERPWVTRAQVAYKRGD